MDLRDSEPRQRSEVFERFGQGRAVGDALALLLLDDIVVVVPVQQHSLLIFEVKRSRECFVCVNADGGTAETRSTRSSCASSSTLRTRMRTLHRLQGVDKLVCLRDLRFP